MLEPPRIVLLVPFYALAAWLAVRIERNRIAEWRFDQRKRQDGTFSVEDLRKDPLISERTQTRTEDAKNQYPSNLREVKAGSNAPTETPGHNTNHLSRLRVVSPSY